MKLRTLCLLLIASTLAACTDDVDSLYTRESAFFRYNLVATTQPLRAALTSAGEWCRITFSNGKQYHFENAHGQTYDYMPTAVSQYGDHTCICGFVVGTPAVPDMSGQTVVAYDAACPECYRESYIQSTLTFASSSTMHCNRCNTTYDLNNSGCPTSGDATNAMLRYRYVTYSEANNTLVIQN